MAAEYPDNIADEHPFYKARSADWTKVSDAYNGGDAFVNDTYIVQHVFEDNASFKKRIERAMYFNVLKRVVNQMVNLIPAEGVIRQGVAEYGQCLQDATGYGTPWGPFFVDAGTVSMLYGNAHILVDYAISQDDSEITTLQDAEDSNLYPTLELFTPLEMINWQKKRRKGYEWCVFKVPRIVDGAEKDVYIKVDYENIEEVLQDGTSVSKAYPHGLGYTPVIDLPFPGVHKKDLRNGLGVDLAYVSKGLLNVGSLSEEIAERHAFNQLTLPDDGMIEELQAKQSDYTAYDVAPETYDMLSNGVDPTLAKLSRSTITTFPASTGHPPAFIAPDSSQLANIWAMVQGSIKLALYAAGVVDMSGVTDPVAVSSMMLGLSGVIERAETVAFKMVSSYMGGSIDIAIVYPTSFSVAPFTEWLAGFSSVAGVATVNDEFKIELLKRLVLDMPGQLTQVEKDTLANMLQIVVEEPAPASDAGARQNS